MGGGGGTPPGGPPDGGPPGGGPSGGGGGIWPGGSLNMRGCYSMSRLLGRRLGKSLTQPLDDVLERSARREDLLHTTLLQGRDVIVGDDAAAEDDDIGRLPPLQLVDNRRKKRHVRARVDRQA